METKMTRGVYDAQAGSYNGWLMVFTASLLFFYTFVVMNGLNMISSDVMSYFNISAPQYGKLAGSYFLANFLCLIPAGLLLDRFSVRKIILFAMLLHIVGMFGLPLAKTYDVAYWSRFLTGVGAAFSFLGCIRLASRCFPPAKMALASGVIVSMGMVGGMVAQTPMKIISDMVGWQKGMIFFGAFGIFLLMFMFLVLRDCAAPDTSGKPATEGEKISVGKTILLVGTNPYNWACAFYTMLMNLPIFIMGVWGGLYLEQARHLSGKNIGYVATMIFIGTLIGSPVIGWISDRLNKRIMPMVVCALLSLALILVFIYAPNLNLASILLLTFLLGFVTSSQVLSYPIAAERNSPLVTGSAISVISIVLMLSGFTLVPWFGKLLELHWDKTVLYGKAIYSMRDFNTAMMMLPIAFIISFVIAIFMRDKK